MSYMRQFPTRGSRGNFATLQPVLSPMLWNSIGTGKRSYKHGIHDLTEPPPESVHPESMREELTRKIPAAPKALEDPLTRKSDSCGGIFWEARPAGPFAPVNDGSGQLGVAGG